MSKAKDTCKKYNYNPGVVDGIIDVLEQSIDSLRERNAEIYPKAVLEARRTCSIQSLLTAKRIAFKSDSSVWGDS